MYYTNAARAAGIFWTAFGGVASRAQPFMRRPEALANKVYAHRLGNGPEASGDGWRYRGGGYIQLTGRTLYGTYSPSGVGLAAHPELIERPEVSARAAALYWTQRGCNGPADRGDIDGTRRMVNGPTMLHNKSFHRALDLVSRGVENSWIRLDLGQDIDFRFHCRPLLSGSPR
ncbi:hypothetical protein GLX28_19370, partial [Deinococcus xianganensis]|nr:hypothetical protein [Deinococcus xianganensis]